MERKRAPWLRRRRKTRGRHNNVLVPFSLVEGGKTPDKKKRRPRGRGARAAFDTLIALVSPAQRDRQQKGICWLWSGPTSTRRGKAACGFTFAQPCGKGASATEKDGAPNTSAPCPGRGYCFVASDLAGRAIRTNHTWGCLSAAFRHCQPAQPLCSEWVGRADYILTPLGCN